MRFSVIIITARRHSFQRNYEMYSRTCVEENSRMQLALPRPNNNTGFPVVNMYTHNRYCLTSQKHVKLVKVIATHCKDMVSMM